ncbi:MAG: phosphatidylserine/phosphatidylglycerophosphate/cardiolipin synthase family protein [Deltaproteobacteria bacterium]
MPPSLQPAPVPEANYPARSGNTVAVLIDGRETFTRIFSVIGQATGSVWITVSFFDPDFRLNPKGPTLFEFLEERAEAGIDVRLLFWWSEYPGIGSFRGDEEDLKALRARGSKVKMRWDRVPRGCHHQKSHIIDGQTAFVGGINLNHDGLSSPSHRDGGFHDLFAEVRGPAAADVEANFRQRWNSASETDRLVYPCAEEADDLPEQTRTGLSPATQPSGSTVQVLRTIAAGLYAAGQGKGEDSIVRAILADIESAGRSIYIENQYLIDIATIEALERAARRGVEVIAVLPLRPDPNLALYKKEKLAETTLALKALLDSGRAALFGLEEGGRMVYVHAKLLIVDDNTLNLGSANLWPPSYRRDSELNLRIWDRRLAATTRARLWKEHLDGARAEGVRDWIGLATEAGARPTGGPGLHVRARLIDVNNYYRFEPDSAPWQGIEARDG